ncbi:hypothetical protein [Brevibacillus sp. NRS-1366]|uniref:hypothetical protein n=1 Tax=Brevibacillus sp. NRS-1366 TaxID=3233899 RepID=UPI003D2166A7
MKKALKKVVSSVLALTFCLVIPFAANAASVSTEKQVVSEKDVLFTVEVNSEEELNEFLAELDTHNKKAQELWEAALAESNNETENIENIDENQISPFALATSTASTRIKWGDTKFYAYIGAYVDYDKVNDRFGTIHGFHMYGLDSDSSAGNVYHEYEKLDNNRTLAVSASALIGVKNGNGIMSYFPYNAYIEFYTSGKGTFY